MGCWDPHISGTFRLSLLFVWLTISALGHGSTAVQPECKHWWPRGDRHIQSYHHLQGDVRCRHLYSSTHYFLLISGNGKVEGTRQKERLNNIMEIRSVNVGIVAIRSVHSGFYLAMNRKGKIYGTKMYSRSCEFKERIEENGYNTYASLHWYHEGRPMFLSLNGRGLPRQGTKTRRQHLSTHFLPMLVS
ncbi:fibroblast growth factor 22 [Rhineura floridana]|uniref:fibroblast growth factor 22 n=1 Tax=Rhineura floridana TaxID=261503 RepID=UPI002AC82A2A|nr:fibroblast growth factor 22 [Rhineura floridana]